MADDDTQDLDGQLATRMMIQRLGNELSLTHAQLLKGFDRFNERLAALEAQAEERVRETRPIWEKALVEIMAVSEHGREMNTRVAEINDRLSSVEKEIRLLGRKIDVFGEDLTRTRVDVRDLDARVGSLEQKPS